MDATATASGTVAATGGSDAPAMVKRFLEAMEARDLARASSMLGEGFTMTFPGGVRFTRLEELIAWAKPRYRGVVKRYERFDVVTAGSGAHAAGGADARGRAESEVVVYCFGTLHGEWPDGIRFIDRFVLRDGRIVDQRVWNDLAETQPHPRSP